VWNPDLILETPKFEPYPYQESAVRSAMKGFKDGRKSQLIIMPTGTGKSYVAAWMSRWAVKNNKRSLVIAHRGELISQLADSHIDLGVPVAIEQAGTYARADVSMPLLGDATDASLGPVCVVASKDSMQGKRLKSWDPDYFGLIITDECHHAVSDTYRKINNHFRNADHLGLTATPDRLDGEDLGQVYESICFQYSFKEAIRDGWLCRPKFINLDTGIDIRSLRPGKSGDYSDSDVAEIILPHIEFLANAIKQEVGDRPTIVFMPDVRTSMLMSSALSSIGLSSEPIYGDAPNRDEVMAGYRRGEFQCLVNAMLITEGVDVPRVSAVAFCRFTNSRALKMQQAGRGMRRGKPDCLLIDFGFLSLQDETLVDCFELFDTYDGDPEILKEARDIVKKGETDDLLDAIGKAERVVAERTKLRIQVNERKVRYGRIIYDFNVVMDSIGMPHRQENPMAQRRMASEGQCRTLGKFGVENPEKMSARRAKVMIDRLIDRRQRNLCTHKQLSHLIANGVEPAIARDTTFEEAKVLLDGFFRRN